MWENHFSAHISQWNLRKQFIAIKQKNSWFDMNGMAEHFPSQVLNRVTYSGLLTPDSLEAHLFLTFVSSNLLVRFLTKVSRSERERINVGDPDEFRIKASSRLRYRLRSIASRLKMLTLVTFSRRCALACNRPQSNHVLSGGKHSWRPRSNTMMHSS